MEEKRGALYIRVSTSEQAELSPAAQKALLLDYAKSHQISVAEDLIFEDHLSGRNARNRPQFQQMIALARQPQHPIDLILVWKFSRFARNQEESIVYKNLLKKEGVEVVSISEPLTDSPFASLIERIIEWMDEYYSIRLSGEVLRGMKQKALSRGYQTSPCLGYDAVGSGKPFVVNEQEMSLVLFIMDLYDREKLSCARIARICNDLGYRTKRGKLFEGRSVKYILTNPFYCGTVTWNGISFQGDHEIRLSRERFEERMKQMKTQSLAAPHRTSSRSRHWLSGILKCSVCGAVLGYHSSGACPYFQCWRYAKGQHEGSSYLSVLQAEEAVYSFFRCFADDTDLQDTEIQKERCNAADSMKNAGCYGSESGSCFLPANDAGSLDPAKMTETPQGAMDVNDLRKSLDPAKMTEIPQICHRDESLAEKEKKTLQAQLSSLKRRKVRLWEAYEHEIIELEEFTKKSELLEKRRKELEEALLRAKAETTSPDRVESKNPAVFLKDAAVSPEKKAAFLRCLFQEITFDREHLLLCFHIR